MKIIPALAIAVFTTAPVFAQASNDFFGTSLPGQGTSTAPPPGAAAAEGALGAPAGGGGGNDFTADEKRMRKKYKANMDEAKKKISRAEKMYKDAEKKKDDKAMKKAKILKEVAEKELTRLKENDPLAGH